MNHWRIIVVLTLLMLIYFSTSLGAVPLKINSQREIAKISATRAEIEKTGFYTVGRDQYLRLIARRALGNANRFEEIADLNNIKGPKHTIYIGQKLKIQLDKALPVPPASVPSASIPNLTNEPLTTKTEIIEEPKLESPNSSRTRELMMHLLPKPTRPRFSSRPVQIVSSAPSTPQPEKSDQKIETNQELLERIRKIQKFESPPPK